MKAQNLVRHPLLVLGLKTLRLGIAFLISYTVIRGIATFTTNESSLFACPIDYDAKTNTISSNSNYLKFPLEKDTKIELLVTTYAVGWQGGGCVYRKSNSNRLEVNSIIEVFNFKIEKLDNGAVQIDGAFIPEYQTFRSVNLFNLNPWTIYTLELTNLGTVTTYGTAPVPRTVIAGSYGSSMSVAKASIVLLSLSLLLIAVTWCLRLIATQTRDVSASR